MMVLPRRIRPVSLRHRISVLFTLHAARTIWAPILKLLSCVNLVFVDMNCLYAHSPLDEMIIMIMNGTEWESLARCQLQKTTGILMPLFGFICSELSYGFWFCLHEPPLHNAVPDTVSWVLVFWFAHTSNLYATQSQIVRIVRKNPFYFLFSIAKYGTYSPFPKTEMRLGKLCTGETFVCTRVEWSEDCFYYCSERNDVVVLFGTLKVQSFILTKWVTVVCWLSSHLLLFSKEETC